MSSEKIAAYSNIPDELKQLKNWLTFSIEDGKKIPRIAGSNKLASSTQPSTWRTYEKAFADVKTNDRHLGFAFAEKDGLVFIDLDDADDADQQKIIKRFKTYQQTSVSGEGRHIIGKGTFEGSGKHPAYPAVGLFKTARLCLMTGQGEGELNTLATADLQAIHTWLSKGKDSPDVDLTDQLPTLPDQTVFELGCDRYPKFYDLTRGHWAKYPEYHNNHSQADQALVGMLCDLTESNEQVRFLFHASGMWTPEREAKTAGHGFTGYINRSIRKIRSNQAREKQLIKDIPLDWTELIPDQSKQGSRGMLESLPEGMIKEMAIWLWEQAYYPLQETALSAAIEGAATISGRCYQTSTGKGLNPWIILVGQTGSGKSEYQNGMNKLFSAVGAFMERSPDYHKMLLGPMASGEGLEDSLAKRNRLNTYFPEFHEAFRNLVDPNSAPAHRSLKYQLLDLHGQSAKGTFLKRRNKAKQKDDVEQEPVEAPCLIVSGETTPGELYGNMNSKDVANGFLQRFIVLNVHTDSISSRPNPKAGIAIPPELLQKLSDMFWKCDQMSQNNEFHYCKLTKEAAKILSKFENDTRDRNLASGADEGMAQLSNRAPLKVRQLASLFAVWRDPHKPVVTEKDAAWALGFIEYCDEQLATKFHSGEVGSGQVKQEREVHAAAKAFTKLSPQERQRKGMVKKVAAEKSLLPLALLKGVVVNNPSFANDRLGAVTAFDRVIVAMINGGLMTKVEPTFANEEYQHLKGVLLVIH